ncbi:MAG: outer membrane lipoprotein carrier protein LolA, partial [Saprospiraceae bacterium]|nr:outer membrane lipoprotein carrier protein LolA [Saprospiraceae bacterium]
MKQASFFILLLLVAGWLPAQDNRYLNSGESDPVATTLLDRMDAYLSQFTAAHVTFTMTMEYPGEETLVYEGKLDQQDNRFRVDVGAYVICSDGVTRWVYVRDVNEVSIYNANPD